jgi:hypothetical protein
MTASSLAFLFDVGAAAFLAAVLLHRGSITLQHVGPLIMTIFSIQPLAFLSEVLL